MYLLRLAALGITLVALSAAAPINVALSGNGGVASQSSTYPGGPASNANDGNTNGNWDFTLVNNSVSHTNEDPNAWWQVNFNAPYVINEINLFNRTDNNGGPRINPFSVYLYDAGNLQVWAASGNTLLAPSVTFAVPNVMASSLRVQLDLKNYLHLAEVQAMTSAVPEPSTYALMAGGLALLGMLRRRKS